MVLFRRSLCALIFILLSQNLYAKPQVITWVLAHEPVSVFDAAAKRMAKVLEEKTNGELTIKTVVQTDLHPMDVIAKVQKGEFQMSQVYASTLGRINPDFWVFDLPFLIRDYAHGEKIYEGKVGQQILAKLDRHHLKGLAFTYSGGYRVVQANQKELRNVEDYKGVKVRVTESPVSAEIFKTLKATPVPDTLKGAEEKLRSKSIDAATTTFARMNVEKTQVKVVNELNLNMFMTGVIVNQDFYNSLPKNQQVALYEAAREAAKIERDTSIEENARIKALAKAKGIHLVQLNERERDDMKKALAPVYKKYQRQFGSLVSEIEKL